MASFTRNDYRAVYNFARTQYLWRESIGHGFDIKAALVMEACEGVIGQQSDFPPEARELLIELPSEAKQKIWKDLL